MNIFLLIAPECLIYACMTIKLHATLLGTYLFISLIGHQRWSKYIGEVVVVVKVGGRLVGSTQLPFITIGGRKSLVNAQMLLEKVWWVPRVN